MKKTIYNIFSLLSMAAVLFAGVACEEENPLDDNKTSDFPELVEDHDVVPGTELTITIQPKSAWSVSINKESYSWFKIKDGKFDKQTLAGVSLDEPKTITIWTTSEESFDLRSCEVTMKVGGESKVIARYTLRAKAKTIEAYKAAVTEEGTFSFVEDGYLYEQTPMAAEDEIELVWDGNDSRFYFPVKIVANYNWTVEWPSWARADINVDSKVGDTGFEIYGIPSALPLEDAEGEITFKDGENVVKTFKVKIPGCKDIFSYTLGGLRSLSFDHAEYFHNGEGTFTKEPVEGEIFGPEGARVVVLEMTENGYVVPQTPWLDVEVSAWDSVDGAAVLQKRDISISAPRYSGKSDRQALILFLPATAPEDLAQILSDGSKGVREEYASYAVSVVQTACPDEYITFEADKAECEEYGLFFEKSQTPLLPEKNFVYAEGAETWQYELSYTKEMADVKSPFYITFPYETISVYDAAGTEIVSDLSEHWLSYNPLGEGLYGQVVMDMSVFKADVPEKIDGYLVFKDETGKVLACLHCFYVAEEKFAEDVLEDASAEMFVDPSAATEAGATIYKVVGGPTYEAHMEKQAPVYILTYTKDNTTLTIKTSTTCNSYQCPANGNNGPELVTIDEQMFIDKELYELIDQYNKGLISTYPDTSNEKSTMGILTFGKTSFETRIYPGYSDFNMTMPEPEQDEETGITPPKPTKAEEVILFADGNSAIEFVFICRLDLTQSATL